MAPPLPRYAGGGPYTQHFGQPSQHQTSHPPPLGGSTNPASYLGGAVNPFAANGNMLGLGAGLNTAGGFGIGADTGLGGHAARMGFANAGNNHPQQHQHQQSHGSMGDHPVRNPSNKGRIREVWKHNLHDEMATIRNLIDDYNYVAMDTEFPGIVARPMGSFRGKSDYHYQCLRVNVDLLRIIQIGITIFNENGETPPARPPSNDPDQHLAGGRRSAGQAPIPYTWQFNFRFSLKEDMYNSSSIESLQSAGLDFAAIERDGIDPHEFAALLIPSGLLCDEKVKWISFHGGYDFGYLMKLLLVKALPNDEPSFEKLLTRFFPSVYDVKHLIKHITRLSQQGLLNSPDPSISDILQKFEQKQGLENISEALKVKRVGTAHQAGSDSLVTGKVFFQIRDRLYGGKISEDHIGRIWGLGFPDAITGAGWSVGGQTGTVTYDATTQNGGNQNQQTNTNGASTNGGPSTPNTNTAALASTTPVPQGHSTQNGLGGLGPMTPGGGTGVFGQFAISQSGNGR